MLTRKMMMLAIFLVCMMAIGAVSAADNAADDIVSIEDSTSIIDGEIDGSQAADEDDLNVQGENDRQSPASENPILGAGNENQLAGTWYVNSSSPNGDGSRQNPFNNLNDALNASKECDTIMIASGTYTGSGNRGLTINTNNLTLVKYGDGEAVFDAEKQDRFLIINANTINIDGLTFQNGQADFGGAIYFRNELIHSSINANFKDNTAKLYGGANFFLSALSAVCLSGNFSDNTANLDGGANYFYNTLNNVCLSGNFTNNTANFGGGANCFEDTLSNVSLSGSFINNTANDCGGANYFTGALVNVSLSGNFIANTAKCTGYRDGGGANFFGGALSDVVLSGNFIANTAEGTGENNGGGANFFVGTLSNVNLSGNFRDNTVNLDGGANYFYEALNNVSLSGNFTNNTAKDCGGANYFNDALDNVSLSGNFIANTAESTSDYDGGGANFFAGALGNVSLSGNFTNNTANFGGGANYFNGTLGNVSLSGNFSDNTANLMYGGANCFVGKLGNVSFSGNFINNTAIYAGGANAFLATSSNVTLSGNFINNTAGFGGGANGFSRLTNVSLSGNFSDNSAYYVGGANFFSGELGNVSLSGNFTNNSAKGGDDYCGGGANFFWNRLRDVSISGNFISNTAEGNGNYNGGGANYFFVRVSNVSLSGNFIANAAKTGSANYFPMTLSNVTIHDSIFLNNKGNYSIYSHRNPVNVTDSWFGNNASNYNETPEEGYNVLMDDWLFLNATAVPDAVSAFGSSDITFKLYSFNGSSSYDNARLNPVNLSVASADGDVDRSIIGLDDAVTYTSAGGKTHSVTASIENAQYTIVLKHVNADPELSLAVQNISYGEYASLLLKYNDNATGTVNITLNGTRYSYSFADKRLNKSIILDELIEPGEYSVVVVYSGDENFLNATAKADFTVKKASAEITVNDTSLDLRVGDSGDIDASLTPADAGNLSYASGNESVIRVDADGRFTAVGAGVADVTVSFAGNDRYAACENRTITVTVALNDASVTVNNETLSLYVDDEFTIVSSTVPDGLNVSYKSDNESVATVKDGVVTAVGEGNAVITVSVGDNVTYSINSTAVSVTVEKIPTQISVANETISLKVIEETPAGCELTPADAGDLAYASSDESVAKVENGNVIALAEGTATITVSFAGNGKYASAENRTIAVTVALNEAEVNVNVSDLELNVDEKATVNVATTPEGLNVTYASSDESVATVKDGVVTAVGSGNATITVSVGGDGVYAENSTAINVKVSKIATEISIANETVDLKATEETETGAALAPAEAGNLTYTSSDESVVKVENGKIIALVEGTAAITVSFAGNGKYASAENRTITVNVAINEAEVDVNVSDLELEIDEKAAFEVTTNPEGLNVTYTSSDESVATVKDGVVTAVGLGNATITVSVDGNGAYEGSAAIKVKVKKIRTEIVANETLEVFIGDMANITYSLTPENAQGNVSFESSNPDVVKVNPITGEITALASGSAIITVKFTGTEKYADTESSVNITVKKLTSKIKAKKKTFKTTTKNKKYKIKLKDKNGKAIANVKVYLKVNGKTYKAKTNSKGVATFKLKKLNKKGIYKAKIKFKGNENYTKASKKVKIKVKPGWKTVSRGSKDKKTVKKIQRALKNNGYYLSYKGRYLMVDGIFESCTERSVKEFQNDKTLKVTGKVDEKTAKKLELI